ncbi:MAG: hypothetical protein ABI180_09735, partial [Microcoleus sp.]
YFRELYVKITLRWSDILKSLDQLFEEDKDDPSKEDILNSLLIALQEVEDGKVHPIAELWDGIDV